MRADRPAGALARSPALLMASGTLASRVTGLMRTAALAAVLGVGVVSDAYNAASVVPTMLLVLVTGGTLSSALVPLLGRHDDGAGRSRAVASVFAALGLLAGASAVGLALAAPLAARVLTLGALGTPGHEQRLRLVTILLVVLAPQVLLLALTAVASALLTAHGRLGRLGWAPVGANLVFLALIAAYPLAGGRPDEPDVPLLALLALGGASTAAAAAGCYLQLRALRDVLPRVALVLRRPDRAVLRDLRSTGSWTLLYAASNQVGLVIVLSVASAQAGAVSAYTWAFAVMQLPYALVAVSVLSATLPALARAAGDVPRFHDLVRGAATTVVLLLVPAAAAIALFAPLAAALLVGQGAGAGSGERLVAHAIGLFALTLVPFSTYQVLARSCYALDRPAWPALTNVGVNVVTILGAVVSAGAKGPAALLTGLVLSYGLSYAVGSVALLVLLARSGVSARIVQGRPVAVVVLGTAAAALLVAVLRRSLVGGWPQTAAELLGYALVAGSALLAVRSALRLRA